MACILTACFAICLLVVCIPTGITILSDSSLFFRHALIAYLEALSLMSAYDILETYAREMVSAFRHAIDPDLYPLLLCYICSKSLNLAANEVTPAHLNGQNYAAIGRLSTVAQNIGADFRFEVPGQSSVGLIGSGRGQWLGGTTASAEHEPIMGVWGHSPQRGPGAELLVRGAGGEAPLKLKAFWSLDVQRSRQI